MNLNCAYGVSRKTGKPPRKRLAYGKRLPTAAMSAATSDARDTGSLRPKPSYYLGPPSSVQPSDLMMADMSMPMPPAIANGVGDHNSLEPSFFAPQCSSFSLEHWDLDLGLDLASAAAVTSAPEKSQGGLSPVTPSVSTQHDCPQESYKVFQALTAAPSLSEVNSDTILAQLDRVLQANRDAIDRLTRLLECSCFKPPYLVMLHSSIISRILGLYQQAAGCAHTVPHGLAAATAAAGSPPLSSSSTPASGTTISASNTKTHTSGISDEVTQLPFSLGKFNIEEPCVQFAFRNVLIGSELKRIGSLIDLFASQSPGNGAEGLYSSLSGWLRTDHSSTVRVLRSTFNELNESIDL